MRLFQKNLKHQIRTKDLWIWKGHTIEDIVVMEYNEFMKDLKSGEDARKNLIHLSTALLKMWRKLDAGD